MQRVEELWAQPLWYSDPIMGLVLFGGIQQLMVPGGFPHKYGWGNTSQEVDWAPLFLRNEQSQRNVGVASGSRSSCKNSGGELGEFGNAPEQLGEQEEPEHR